ncbi:sulfite exporter TauE/SafE family protein [Thiofilum flexile]|uniref:sulfite exporter TauE/SafE family protein n=1 Tax=Thiofilum flexile TaxID=125627 RepID=UPI000369F25F|nr:sulfite exporter TauE/SafE family protein [Thiofilum flexile]
MLAVDGWGLVAIGIAGILAGLINALAGGGTLVTFPTLVALGIPPIAANVTSTVALCPGYLGATLAQWKEIRAQQHYWPWVLPIAVFGGLVGALLLLQTDEKVFSSLVPWLILLASILLALQNPLRNWLKQRLQNPAHAHLPVWWVVPLVCLGAIYGGYFGAGLSVIILAVLALVLEGTLTELNALKQAVAFCVNVAAAVFFLFSGEVVWLAAGIMAIGALIGGMLGGKLAGFINPNHLRTLVVTLGITIALVYWFK